MADVVVFKINKILQGINPCSILNQNLVYFTTLILTSCTNRVLRFTL